jgi:hypothetical protein
MARFGIEGIRYFGALRASGVASADDLTYVFNICNGLDGQLRDAGHTRVFYWANDDCWEIDLRSSSMGGIDDDWSDDVDLFFILTHGNHSSGNALLAYNVNRNDWLGNSSQWRLGNDNIEWLLIYGCHTIDLGNPLSFWNIFQRLHEFCGAWGDMWDGITTDEVGEDVGDNLQFERLWQIKATGMTLSGQRGVVALCRVVGAFRRYLYELPVWGRASAVVELADDNVIAAAGIDWRPCAG